MEGIQYYLCVGAFIGSMITGIIGIILGQIREARGRIRQLTQPLDTFPDAAQPRMTALGILKNGIRAIFICAFWIIVLIVVVIFLVPLAVDFFNLGL